MAEGMRHPSVSGGLEGRGEDGSERAHSSSALRGVCKFGVSGNRAFSEERRAHAKANEHLMCTGNQK